MARQLQTYIQAEAELFRQREERDEEIRKLRSRCVSLEKELEKLHQNLEEEAQAKV
jgi:cell division protein FtsB